MDSSGGVARYHRIQEGANARVSTEITGYAVSALLDLHERLGLQTLLGAAQRAADFLCDKAWRKDLQAMPFEWSEDRDLPEDHTYFFDCGIIIRGLLRAWKRTGEARYLEIAIGCGESMRRDFENAEDIHPILQLPDKSPTPRDARWSRSSDCYQLKSALGWLDLAEATGDVHWVRHYERCLERSLRTEADFLAREPGVRVMDRLHSYGYFLEAILPRADRPEVGIVLTNGILRAESHLRRVRGEFERSDSCAQLLRVRMFADALGIVPLDTDRAAEEATWAARYQASSSDRRIDGGYYFGWRSGALAPFANPVSTAFCAQALAMWAERDTAKDSWDWRNLI